MSELHDWITEVKAQGKKVVFTNGVFDILHLGHVTYLEEAADLGDFLVVGINDDASVRKLNKGPERPINDEEARAGVISALRSVDAVIVFGEDTPLELIQTIEPDVVVKGGDYDASERDPRRPSYIVGSNETLERGGEVHAIALVEGFSTTSLIKKMRAK
jgi:D-glycero-beta-D-manno-heptose 1-phosphate adenylyltransferase